MSALIAPVALAWLYLGFCGGLSILRQRFPGVIGFNDASTLVAPYESFIALGFDCRALAAAHRRSSHRRSGFLIRRATLTARDCARHSALARFICTRIIAWRAQAKDQD
jgi:hypothetical protein